MIEWKLDYLLEPLSKVLPGFVCAFFCQGFKKRELLWPLLFAATLSGADILLQRK